MRLGWLRCGGLPSIWTLMAVVAGLPGCGAASDNDGAAMGMGGATNSGGTPGNGGTPATGGSQTFPVGGTSPGGSAAVGGNPGMGGSAAVGGNPGTGGASNAILPACTEDENILGGCVVDANDATVMASLQEEVIIDSITTVQTWNCSPFDQSYDAEGPAQRIAVSSGDQQWTVILRLPNLPADYFQVGESLNLLLTVAGPSVFGGHSTQQLGLSRANQLVALLDSGLVLGGLDDFPITPVASEAYCEDPVGFACGKIEYSLTLSSGVEMATIIPGETAPIADWSFSVEQNYTTTSNGMCDARGNTVLGAFLETPDVATFR